MAHRLGDLFFAACEGGLVGFRKSDAPATLPTAAFKQLLLDRSRHLHLKVEQVLHRVGVYAVKHRLEQAEGLALVLDQRVFLGVAAQVYAFFQMIERQQVILPLRVNDVEHDVALKVAHALDAHLHFFFGVLRFNLRPEDFRRVFRA